MIFILCIALIIGCGKERGGGGDEEFEFSSDPGNPNYYNKYSGGSGDSYVPNSIGNSTGTGTTGNFSDGGSGLDLNAAATPTDVGQTANFLQNLIGQLRASDQGDGGAMLSMLMELLQQLKQKRVSNEVLGKALFASLIAKHCAKGVKQAGQAQGPQPRPGMGASKVGSAKKALSVAMCFAKAMKKMFPKLKIIIVQMGPEGLKALKQQVTGALPPSR